MQSENIAKTVLITSTLVIFIIVGMLYLARDAVVNYLIAETVSPTITNEIINTRTAEEQIVTMIERVNPAVVSVVVTKDVPIYERYYEQYDRSTTRRQI